MNYWAIIPESQLNPAGYAYAAHFLVGRIMPCKSQSRNDLRPFFGSCRYAFYAVLCI